jgi:hypothetical protein
MASLKEHGRHHHRAQSTERLDSRMHWYLVATPCGQTGMEQKADE